MAKVNNTNSNDFSEMSAKELKVIADQKGIDYLPNATASQMRELLNSSNDAEKVIEETSDKLTNANPEVVDVNALLKKINDLENLVKTTGDHNKIKEFEDAQKGMQGFSFSVKLFPTDEGEFPVTSWRTVKNYVARNDKDKTEQIIEITYLKDGEEKKQEIDLVDFVRVLKRTKPILAKEIKNLDGSDVYIDKKANAEDDLEFYLLRPKKDTFNVNLVVNNQEIQILSTYLNA